VRFLHTADWHVGRTIRGRSRFDEFAQALDVVVDVAADQGVDAVLLAGDIHDQRSVSPEADRLIFDAFIRLSEKSIPVVAIPGNHDSALRLEAFAPLLERVGTHVVPRVYRPDAGGLVEVRARDDGERALVACLPFVSPRRFSDAAALFEDVAKGFVDFDESMGKLIAAYEGAFHPAAVNVLMGHVFISGSQPGGSEREVTIGADYAVSPTRLPKTASYVALGHIHKPQKIKGAPGEARYCGSLLQLDFGERGQDKSLVVVDAHPGKPPKTTEIPIDVGRKLLDVDITLDDLTRVSDEVGDAYVRVNLSIDSPIPGVADRVREALPNALDIRLVLPERPEEAEATSLRGLSPREQFVSYYSSAHQADPSDEVLGAFDRVYDEVTA
jgi:DNA repair protein SbcD/Mre11